MADPLVLSLDWIVFLEISFFIHQETDEILFEKGEGILTFQTPSCIDEFFYAMKNNLLQKDGDIIYVSTRDAVKVSNEQSVFCKIKPISQGFLTLLEHPPTSEDILISSVSLHNYLKMDIDTDAEAKRAVVSLIIVGQRKILNERLIDNVSLSLPFPFGPTN
jgi:hypothetical protein